MEQVEAATGKRPPQLDEGGELPLELEHVWHWFIALSEARPTIEPLTYTELRSFFSLQHIEPLPLELMALKRLDAVWCIARKAAIAATQHG